MPALTSNFWGWDSPLIEKAVRHLSRDHVGHRALDLADTLVVVPTAESARRLREALATAAAARDSAVMAPWVWHPAQCLITDADRRRTATPAQALLAWVAVLQATDLGLLTHLFPTPPDAKSSAWLTNLARTLIDLQSTLGAGGLAFTDVALSQPAAQDRLRWNDLADLEREFDALLREKDLASPQRVRLERARAPALPPDVRRICVIGVADPPPLFATWLHSAASGVDVEICVQAPEAQTDHFDAIGRPLESHWGGQSIVIPLDESSLHVLADPAAQSARTAALMRELLPLGRTAVGVCDAETAAHVEDHLATESVHAYEPGGKAAAKHGVISFARLWCDLIHTGSWKSFAALLRIPEFARTCCACGQDAAIVLRAADDFADARLPVTLDGAAALLRGASDHEQDAAVLTAVRQALDLAAKFKELPLPEAVRALLLRLYGEHQFHANQPHERDLMQLTTKWIQITDALESDAPLLAAKLDEADSLALSVQLLAEEQTSDPRGEVDLVIQGWLELLWEPAPNLIVLGCNEENLPGILTSHPFVPDHLRAALALPSQSSRYARDAYLLRALTAQREKRGSLHLLCGQWSERGDALRPSRLLFLCDDGSLPRRVNHLFPKDGAPIDARQPSRTWAWKLRPRATPAPQIETISASRLRDYIACPFRCYLRHDLRMDAVDPTKAEMSAGEFGGLIHTAFKALADENSLRDCTDEEKIASFLGESARAQAARIYGRRLPFTVRLQLESAIQRLEAAAQFEAAHRAEGWRTLHGEFVIGAADDPHPFMLGTRRLTGRIDRIDQRGDEFLILDFKSREKPVPPMEAHLLKLSARKASGVEEWLLHHDAEGVTWKWTDLQLPLYARAWSLRRKGTVSVGYFQLPTSIQGTQIDLWQDMNDALLDSAARCAEEAVSRLDRRIHWPPHDDVEYDDFEELFAGHPVEDVIDSSEITSLACPLASALPATKKKRS